MWLQITADLPSSCPFFANRSPKDSTNLAWSLRLRSQSLDAGWGLLFKIVLLNTLKAPGSKRIATLRSWLSLEETLWLLVAESHSNHRRLLSGTAATAQDHLAAAVQAAPPLTCFMWPLSGVWLSLTTKSSCRSPAKWPGTAQPLSVCWCRGCSSNGKISWLSWVMDAWPILLPSFWDWHLKPQHRDVTSGRGTPM